jgi:hypothetical protein
MPDEVREPTNEQAYAAKRAWHREQARLPIEEKIRILLELQEQDLELIRRLRPLEWYERRWPIQP